MNYSPKPPVELAVVEMDDRGTVTIVRATPKMREHLQRGVVDDAKLAALHGKGKINPRDTLTTPAEGARYMDLLLHEFNGTFVRAGEVTV